MKRLILFLLLSLPAWGQSTFVQAKCNQQGSGGNAITATWGAATTAGNSLIAFVQSGSSSTDTVTISDSSGSGTWTQTSSGYASGGANRAAMFSKPNSAATTTVTATWLSSVNIDICVLEFTNSVTTALNDASVNATAASNTTTTSGSLTTTNTDDILVFGVRLGGAYTSPACGTGYTLPTGGDAAHREFVCYKIVAATQSGITTTATWTTAEASVDIFGGFKATPTGGGGGTTATPAMMTMGIGK